MACLLWPAISAAQDRDPRYVASTSLLNQGAPLDALPYAEALVSDQPDNKLYRFQLAVALFQLGRDGRAKFHLERLRGAALSEGERALVSQMISQIDARKVWGAHFSLNVKPESNGLKQTEQRVLDLGGLPVVLRDTAIGKPTVSTIVTTGFSYSPTIRPGLKAQFSLNLLLKHNEEVALRDHQLIGRAGLLSQQTDQSATGGGLLLGKRWVADAAYSDTAGLYLFHGRRVGPRGTLRYGAEISRDFRTEGRPDVDRVLLNLEYAHVVTPSLQLTFGGLLERSATDQATLDGHRAALSLSGLYAFDGGLMAGLTLRGEVDNRTGVSPLFGVAREDRTLGIDLRIYHRDFRIGSFAPELIMGIERNKSNIPLARYTNKYLSVGLTRKF